MSYLIIVTTSTVRLFWAQVIIVSCSIIILFKNIFIIHRIFIGFAGFFSGIVMDC